MGAGNADGVVVPAHQQPPRLPALDNGQAEGARGDDFRVLVKDGGGADDGGGAAHVLFPLAYHDAGAQAFQPVGVNGALAVRALHAGAHMQQKLGERPHGHPADAAEMNGFFIGYQFFQFC